MPIKAFQHLLFILLLSSNLQACSAFERPDPAPYYTHQVVVSEPQVKGLNVTFLGTSTLLFRDGQHSVLIDGFFSRPSLWQLLSFSISSDRDTVK